MFQKFKSNFKGKFKKINLFPKVRKFKFIFKRKGGFKFQNPKISKHQKFQIQKKNSKKFRNSKIIIKI